ncbi:MAG: SDR family oxidoreductase [Actinobacteria bacterium]|nr:SDR family oxidoreductase [Actinomycetota bacterium]
MSNLAIVTGAFKGGIGGGISRVLAQDGFKVLMLARNAQRLSKLEAELKSDGLDVESWSSDITDRQRIKSTVNGIQDKYGQIHVLVNNAGLMPFPASLQETDDKLWDDLVNTNLTGTFNMTKAVLPGMIDKKYGRIINISSVSARKTVGNFVAYAAAKGALHAFTTALANEVGVNGITVNCILPGFTETDTMHHIWGTVAEGAGMSEDELLKPFWAQIPLGRWIQPEEIGNAVAFLASDRAAVITGQILKVDGGYDNHD